MEQHFFDDIYVSTFLFVLKIESNNAFFLQFNVLQKWRFENYPFVKSCCK